MGIKILTCHQNDNRSLFSGFSEECCDGNVSGKGCVSSVLVGTPELCTRGCQNPEANNTKTGGGGGGGHQRREESVQHNLHKPSHLSLRNKFFKVLCEWNGL